MAAQQFDVSLGRGNELHDRVVNNDPATSGIVVVAFQATGIEANDVLLAHETLASVLGSTNVEADFTNYARIVLTDSDLSLSVVDHVDNRRYADMADFTWISAGGGTDNTLAKLATFYAPDTGGADSTFVPLSLHDFSTTTTGADLPAQLSTDHYIFSQRAA